MIDHGLWDRGPEDVPLVQPRPSWSILSEAAAMTRILQTLGDGPHTFARLRERLCTSERFPVGWLAVLLGRLEIRGLVRQDNAYPVRYTLTW